MNISRDSGSLTSGSFLSDNSHHQGPTLFDILFPADGFFLLSGWLIIHEGSETCRIINTAAATITSVWENDWLFMALTLQWYLTKLSGPELSIGCLCYIKKMFLITSSDVSAQQNEKQTNQSKLWLLSNPLTSDFRGNCRSDWSMQLCRDYSLFKCESPPESGNIYCFNRKTASVPMYHFKVQLKLNAMFCLLQQYICYVITCPVFSFQKEI